MRTRPATRPLPVTPPAVERRSRWPVFFSALILLWCAWWYCRGEDQGLLYLASAVAALAVARPRPLPATARWVIWSGIVLAVFCLAANVTRLAPPENALEESRNIDRLITVVFAAGLTALFFRPSADSVTLVSVGGLPMAMVALARDESAAGAAAGSERLVVVWGVVALVMAADLAQRLTATRPAERLVPAAGEAFRRLLLMAAVAVLAFGLRLPVERVVKSVQKQMFGWLMYAERRPRRRMEDLLLTLPAPANFGTRMRAVLLIEAQGVPGYLRESVYLRYRAGRWTASKPEVPLKEAQGPAAERRRGVYALVPSPGKAAAGAWRVEVLASAMVSGFCLPGNALTLTCEGLPPLAETNGAVAANGALPDTYALSVAPRRLLERAYPGPEGESVPECLEVPDALAGAVSNWVAECAGFAGAPSLAAAIRRVEDHFATNFTYRLGVRMRADPDPLVDFMARREGSCALFASAAALMFRSCGVPSRVIGGYVCADRNPWLDRWVVRERDGHAWVEVWDRGAGRWLVADPTPPEGLSGALRRPGALRLAFDLWAAGWRRLLAYLRGANFLEALAEIGATLFLFVWQVVWSLPGAVVLAGFGAVWWLRRRMRRRALGEKEQLRGELAQAMRRLERQSVAVHLRRRAVESWGAWLGRVGPELSPERLEALRQGLEQYQALRYSVTLDEAAARVWIGRARSMKRPRARRKEN